MFALTEAKCNNYLKNENAYLVNYFHIDEPMF